jgi:hypothetical protein
MTEIIKTNGGEPFKTEEAAQARQTVLAKRDVVTKVVAEDGGWVLEVDQEVKATAKKRPKRVPIGTRNILKYPKRPGYRRRVVNDTEDRIKIFKDAGYEIVQNKSLPTGDPRAGDASQMGMPVAKNVGGGMKGVLMEIPEEWYVEDQKAKQDKIKAQEAAMRDQNYGVEGGYGGMKTGT